MLQDETYLVIWLILQAIHSRLSGFLIPVQTDKSPCSSARRQRNVLRAACASASRGILTVQDIPVVTSCPWPFERDYCFCICQCIDPDDQYPACLSVRARRTSCRPGDKNTLRPRIRPSPSKSGEPPNRFPPELQSAPPLLA